MQQQSTPASRTRTPGKTGIDPAAVAALQRRVNQLVSSEALTEPPYSYHR